VGKVVARVEVVAKPGIEMIMSPTQLPAREGGSGREAIEGENRRERRARAPRPVAYNPP